MQTSLHLHKKSKEVCIKTRSLAASLLVMHKPRNSVTTVKWSAHVHGHQHGVAVTWYKIHHAGEQTTHWDIQNNENANLS